MFVRSRYHIKILDKFPEKHIHFSVLYLTFNYFPSHKLELTAVYFFSPEIKLSNVENFENSLECAPQPSNTLNHLYYFLLKPKYSAMYFISEENLEYVSVTEY